MLCIVMIKKKKMNMMTMTCFPYHDDETRIWLSFYSSYLKSHKRVESVDILCRQLEEDDEQESEHTFIRDDDESVFSPSSRAQFQRDKLLQTFFNVEL